MEQLWAPWRLAYIAASKPPTEQDACFICTGLADQDDRKHLIALRSTGCAVVLNRYPYNNGHLLVAPLTHTSKLDELEVEQVLDIQQTLARMIRILDAKMRPDGYNVGLNLGRIAGAGLPGHLHWHIVPRWAGDTNFMPVVADVRVISQSLDSFYELLTQALAEGA